MAQSDTAPPAVDPTGTAGHGWAGGAARPRGVHADVIQSSLFITGRGVRRSVADAAAMVLPDGGIVRAFDER